jgi:alpha-mannosidase
MKRISFSLFFLISFGFVAFSQTNLKDMIKIQARIAGEMNVAVEGFGRKISGEDITYQSTRSDCQNALLVRATDGTMNITWESSVIKPDTDAKEIELFLIAGMSLQGYSTKGVDPGFSVLINEKTFFHFKNSMGENWMVTGPSGSRMVFQAVIKDQANDGFGYARMILPTALLEKGKPVSIRIVGDASETRHWFMIFQCTDGLDWFMKKTKIDTWFDLSLTESAGRYLGKIAAPETWAGKKVEVIPNSGVIQKVTLPEKNSVASSSFFIPLEIRSISIKGPDGFVLENVILGSTQSKSLIQSDRLMSYQISQPEIGKWLIQAQASASTIAKDLRNIADSKIAHGKMHIMASSHQDIAWMDSPQACVEDRDNLLITPALKILEENPNYYNDMEDILILREYLGRHPEKKKLIHQLTSEGRLTWGASYMQPYEEMYFGEALIRQFYLGRKWFKKEFAGCDARIYWNVDVPGRTLQMPQILSKSGVDYMIISRHDKGLFHWGAPDGSKILTYSPGHYYNSYVNLKKGFFESIRHFSELADFWGQYYGDHTVNPVVPILSDADMAVPDSYFDYIETWNSLKDSSLRLPELVHSTAEKFLDEAVATNVSFPTIHGERPAVWLYIHGPSHVEALTAGRSAGRLLPVAEKMACFSSMVSGDWSQYPSEKLNHAWESAIYPDHGWGGKNGEITDQTFLDKFREADQIAKSIIEKSTGELAGSIDFSGKGIPLVVFNSLTWERSDPVEILLNIPDKTFKAISLIDENGKPVSFQLKGEVEYFSSGYFKSAEIVFISEKIPSLGFKTYYVVSGRKMANSAVSIPLADVFDTPYYRVRFGVGGIESLYDKELRRELLNTDQFKGGSLFSMHSFGNGAGEFSDIQQPDMEEFEMCDMGPVWSLIENGPVRIVIRSSAKMNHNDATITFTFYQGLKRVDVKVDLVNWDGTAYREFRLAFPARMQSPEISYEVPFGVVRVGKDELAQPAGERYTTPCKDVHPRGINNWISANDSDFGLTISSSVAVWDYVNMTNLSTDAILLQPILLASRQSCHGEGPLYHQRGSHSMEFSLFSHSPGWKNGYHKALQANEKLITVFNPVKKSSILPEQISFLSVDASGAIVSTVKKVEDDNGIIVRLYDQEGMDKNVRIQLFRNPVSGEHTNLIEEDGKPIKIEPFGAVIKLGHHAIETLKFKY